MNAVTRDLPCFPIKDGLPTFETFTGQDIGPFFIHHGRADRKSPSQRGDWTVTHIATGYSVQKDIMAKARAVRLARQLAKLDCWGFTDAEQTRAISPSILRLIADLRSRA